MTKLPPGSKIIGVKWVYKTKLNVNGEVDKYKARLVAKGYSQKYGVDYVEVASLEKKLDSVLNMVPKIAEVCVIWNIPGATQEENEKPNDELSNVTSSFEALNLHKAEKPYTPPIPFPRRLAKSKQDKNMPAYGKFFKELNNYKRKYGPNKKVVVSEKCLGDLKATTISLQLVDRSVKYPRGIGEDIFVQVDKLILPTDFVVLDMEEAPIHDHELPILLGRPFMATAKTIIDV
ncbi:uncharacterized protein LOC125473530 [Pyrus x bretschneideri]|uniref:uncharacterized protein LOC125473530 n=1 Tax=Pyrus x bretschneideri TaxID=225117 RepID=UPI00202E30A7|nr:uncharacterized protein LOC125473530 [Pyrus x bretschneideri]